MLCAFGVVAVQALAPAWRFPGLLANGFPSGLGHLVFATLTSQRPDGRRHGLSLADRTRAGPPPNGPVGGAARACGGAVGWSGVCGGPEPASRCNSTEMEVMALRIEQLTLHARDLGATRAFYAGRLGLPVHHTGPAAMEVRFGATPVTFRLDSAMTGAYHFACNVPGPAFGDARRWLGARAPLLTDGTGETAFTFEAWNASAAYVHDPDGHLVELIARHGLRPPEQGSPGPPFVQNVSEIGLVVEDVPATVEQARRQLGLTPYLGQTHPEFTAVGDEQGLLIVVRRHRPWFPTRAPAHSPPLSVTLEAVGRRGTLDLRPGDATPTWRD